MTTPCLCVDVCTCTSVCAYLFSVHVFIRVCGYTCIHLCILVRLYVTRYIYIDLYKQKRNVHWFTYKCQSNACFAVCSGKYHSTLLHDTVAKHYIAHGTSIILYGFVRYRNHMQVKVLSHTGTRFFKLHYIGLPWVSLCGATLHQAARPHITLRQN